MKVLAWHEAGWTAKQIGTRLRGDKSFARVADILRLGIHLRDRRRKLALQHIANDIGAMQAEWKHCRRAENDAREAERRGGVA